MPRNCPSTSRRACEPRSCCPVSGKTSVGLEGQRGAEKGKRSKEKVSWRTADGLFGWKQGYTGRGEAVWLAKSRAGEKHVSADPSPWISFCKYPCVLLCYTQILLSRLQRILTFPDKFIRFLEISHSLSRCSLKLWYRSSKQWEEEEWCNQHLKGDNSKR